MSVAVKYGQDMVEKDCIQLKPGNPHKLIFLLIILIGCAGNYGGLVRDHEANEIFKTYQILPDYRYYYSGPEGRPEAILAIRHDYTLKTTQWTEFSATRELLKKWVDWLDFNFGNRVHYYPYGSAILGPGSQQVGIWYSIWDWTPVIFHQENIIEVYPPMRSDPLNNPGDDVVKDRRH